MDNPISPMVTRQAMLRRGVAGAIALGAPAIVARPALAAGAGFDEIRHLLSRTGFGPRPDEISALEALDYAGAVDRVLGAWRPQAGTPAPAWVGMALAQTRARQREFQQRRETAAAAPKSEPSMADATGAPPARPRGAAMEPKPLVNANPIQEQGRELRNWWVEEMLATDQPLVERMVLFWHGHFTSALQKVRFAPAMFHQNALFRRHALGNFGALLRDVARDPAMLVYLDNAQNRASQPNENFARELLELFTLGEGHYAESDIKAAARAFTGWSIDRDSGAYRFYPAAHDSGPKTLLGQTGDLDGGDVVDILLRQPRTAELIVGKLWREFVSLKPDGAEIARLATAFRAANYEIRPLLKALLSSATFRDAASRGGLIKSPVELIVGTVRVLGLPVPEKTRLVRAMQSLGQVPFEPPNVKGWAGGEAWITTSTLLMRQQIMRRIIEASTVAMADGAGTGMMARPGRRMDRREQMAGDDATMQLPPDDSTPVEGRSLRDAGMSARVGGALAGLDAGMLTRTLVPVVPRVPPTAGASAGRIVAALLLDPVFQLK